MSDDSQDKSDCAERDRPPGQPRSWERRTDPTVAAEKRWVRLAKTLLYAVWITVLVIAIVAIVLHKLNPSR